MPGARRRNLGRFADASAASTTWTAPSTSGEITLTLTVTDLGGNSGAAAIIITVTAGANDAPTITGTPATTVAQGELYNFTPGGGDVDTNTTLTYSINETPSWAVFNTATGELRGTPGNADVGITTGIVISVTDGIIMSPVSLPAFDLEVTNVNDDPSGLPTISGTATQGETLTAETDTIADDDGLGAFSYQWNTRDGNTAISGATSATYVLTRAEVGQAITVTVSYTDDRDTAESLTSDPTATVTDPNARFADLNNVILPEMARALADQTVSAITQRIGQAGSGGSARSVTIAGQSTLAGAASAHGQAIADGTLSLKDVLGNSDFVLPLSDAGGTDGGVLSSLTLWGGGGYRSFEGSGGGQSTSTATCSAPIWDWMPGRAVTC